MSGGEVPSSPSEGGFGGGVLSLGPGGTRRRAATGTAGLNRRERELVLV